MTPKVISNLATDLVDDEKWEFTGWAECGRAESCEELWKCGGYCYEYRDREHQSTTFQKCCTEVPLAFDVIMPNKGLAALHWVYCKFMEDDDDLSCGEHCYFLGRVAVYDTETSMQLKVCPQGCFDDDVDPEAIMFSTRVLDDAIEEDYDPILADDDEKTEEDAPFPTDKDFEDTPQMLEDVVENAEQTTQKRYKFLRWDPCIPTQNCGWAQGFCIDKAALVVYDREKKEKKLMCDFEILEEEIESFICYDEWLEINLTCGYGHAAGYTPFTGRFVPLRQMQQGAYEPPKPKIKIMFFQRSNPTPDLKEA